MSRDRYSPKKNQTLVSSFGNVAVASQRNPEAQTKPGSTDFKPGPERSQLSLLPDCSFDCLQPHTDPGQTHNSASLTQGNRKRLTMRTLEGVGPHFLQAHKERRPMTQFPLVWTGLLPMDLMISQASSTSKAPSSSTISWVAASQVMVAKQNQIRGRAIQNRHPQTTVLRPKSGLLPVFVNKVLLQHSHVHLFRYCLWLLSCYNGRVE